MKNFDLLIGGIASIGLGLLFAYEGWNAYGTHTIVPGAEEIGKHGWLTGPQAMIIGAAFVVFGLWALAHWSKKLRNEENN